MIQGMTYPHIDEGAYAYQNYIQDQTNDGLNSINQLSSDLNNSSKKQPYQLKFIKQLKSKDIKLSRKKIQVLPNKVNPTAKNFTSFSKERLSNSNDKTVQKTSDNEQINKSNKHKKVQNFEKPQDRQRENEAINSFNPEYVVFSKQSTILNREKYSKKLKASQANSFQQRVRQSRSQSKKDKANGSNIYQNIKSTLNPYENQTNIFQNIDFLAKHNSYHSLDKNHQQVTHNIGLNPFTNLKVQQKLHLPSLVNINGLKNTKHKVQHTINLAHQHNQTQLQRTNLYAERISKTEKSTPYIQKTVKIPIERLKPLRPEQIKLKFQQKVKEEQKNRAKQRAIQMFQKQQEEAQFKKQHSNFMHDLESEEELNRTEIKGMQNEQFQEIRNKPSLGKRQKLFANNKGQNIFKMN